MLSSLIHSIPGLDALMKDLFGEWDLSEHVHVQSFTEPEVHLRNVPVPQRIFDLAELPLKIEYSNISILKAKIHPRRLWIKKGNPSEPIVEVEAEDANIRLSFKPVSEWDSSAAYQKLFANKMKRIKLWKNFVSKMGSLKPNNSLKQTIAVRIMNGLQLRIKNVHLEFYDEHYNTIPMVIEAWADELRIEPVSKTDPRFTEEEKMGLEKFYLSCLWIRILNIRAFFREVEKLSDISDESKSSPYDFSKPFASTPGQRSFKVTTETGLDFGVLYRRWEIKSIKNIKVSENSWKKIVLSLTAHNPTQSSAPTFDGKMEFDSLVLHATPSFVNFIWNLIRVFDIFFVWLRGTTRGFRQLATEEENSKFKECWKNLLQGKETKSSTSFMETFEKSYPLYNVLENLAAVEKVFPTMSLVRRFWDNKYCVPNSLNLDPCGRPASPENQRDLTVDFEDEGFSSETSVEDIFPDTSQKKLFTNLDFAKTGSSDSPFREILSDRSKNLDLQHWFFLDNHVNIVIPKLRVYVYTDVEPGQLSGGPSCFNLIGKKVAHKVPVKANHVGDSNVVLLNIDFRYISEKKNPHRKDNLVLLDNIKAENVCASFMCYPAEKEYLSPTASDKNSSLDNSPKVVLSSLENVIQTFIHPNAPRNPIVTVATNQSKCHDVETPFGGETPSKNIYPCGILEWSEMDTSIPALTKFDPKSCLAIHIADSNAKNKKTSTFYIPHLELHSLDALSLIKFLPPKVLATRDRMNELFSLPKEILSCWNLGYECVSSFKTIKAKVPFLNIYLPLQNYSQHEDEKSTFPLHPSVIQAGTPRADPFLYKPNLQVLGARFSEGRRNKGNEGKMNFEVEVRGLDVLKSPEEMSCTLATASINHFISSFSSSSATKLRIGFLENLQFDHSTVENVKHVNFQTASLQAGLVPGIVAMILDFKTWTAPYLAIDRNELLWRASQFSVNRRIEKDKSKIGSINDNFVYGQKDIDILLEMTSLPSIRPKLPVVKQLSTKSSNEDPEAKQQKNTSQELTNSPTSPLEKEMNSNDKQTATAKAKASIGSVGLVVYNSESLFSVTTFCDFSVEALTFTDPVLTRGTCELHDLTTHHVYKEDIRSRSQDGQDFGYMTLAASCLGKFLGEKDIMSFTDDQVCPQIILEDAAVHAESQDTANVRLTFGYQKQDRSHSELIYGGKEIPNIAIQIEIRNLHLLLDGNYIEDWKDFVLETSKSRSQLTPFSNTESPGSPDTPVTSSNEDKIRKISSSLRKAPFVTAYLTLDTVSLHFFTKKSHSSSPVHSRPNNLRSGIFLKTIGDHEIRRKVTIAHGEAVGLRVFLVTSFELRLEEAEDNGIRSIGSLALERIEVQLMKNVSSTLFSALLSESLLETSFFLSGEKVESTESSPRIPDESNLRQINIYDIMEAFSPKIRLVLGLASFWRHNILRPTVFTEQIPDLPEDISYIISPECVPSFPPYSTGIHKIYDAKFLVTPVFFLKKDPNIKDETLPSLLTFNFDASRNFTKINIKISVKTYPCSIVLDQITKEYFDLLFTEFQQPIQTLFEIILLEKPKEQKKTIDITPPSSSEVDPFYRIAPVFNNINLDVSMNLLSVEIALSDQHVCLQDTYNLQKSKSTTKIKLSHYNANQAMRYYSFARRPKCPFSLSFSTKAEFHLKSDPTATKFDFHIDNTSISQRCAEAALKWNEDPSVEFFVPTISIFFILYPESEYQKLALTIADFKFRDPNVSELIINTNPVILYLKKHGALKHIDDRSRFDWCSHINTKNQASFEMITKKFSRKINGRITGVRIHLTEAFIGRLFDAYVSLKHVLNVINTVIVKSSYDQDEDSENQLLQKKDGQSISVAGSDGSLYFENTFDTFQKQGIVLSIGLSKERKGTQMPTSHLTKEMDTMEYHQANQSEANGEYSEEEQHSAEDDDYSDFEVSSQSSVSGDPQPFLSRLRKNIRSVMKGGKSRNQDSKSILRHLSSISGMSLHIPIKLPTFGANLLPYDTKKSTEVSISGEYLEFWYESNPSNKQNPTFPHVILGYMICLSIKATLQQKKSLTIKFLENVAIFGRPTSVDIISRTDNILQTDYDNSAKIEKVIPTILQGLGGAFLIPGGRSISFMRIRDGVIKVLITSPKEAERSFYGVKAEFSLGCKEIHFNIIVDFIWLLSSKVKNLSNLLKQKSSDSESAFKIDQENIDQMIWLEQSIRLLELTLLSRSISNCRKSLSKTSLASLAEPDDKISSKSTGIMTNDNPEINPLIKTIRQFLEASFSLTTFNVGQNLFAFIFNIRSLQLNVYNSLRKLVEFTFADTLASGSYPLTNQGDIKIRTSLEMLVHDSATGELHSVLRRVNLFARILREEDRIKELSVIDFRAMIDQIFLDLNSGALQIMFRFLQSFDSQTSGDIGGGRGRVARFYNNTRGEIVLIKNQIANQPMSRFHLFVKESALIPVREKESLFFAIRKKPENHGAVSFPVPKQFLDDSELTPSPQSPLSPNRRHRMLELVKHDISILGSRKQDEMWSQATNVPHFKNRLLFSSTDTAESWLAHLASLVVWRDGRPEELSVFSDKEDWFPLDPLTPDYISGHAFMVPEVGHAIIVDPCIDPKTSTWYLSIDTALSIRNSCDKTTFMISLRRRKLTITKFTRVQLLNTQNNVIEVDQHLVIAPGARMCLPLHWCFLHRTHEITIEPVPASTSDTDSSESSPKSIVGHIVLPLVGEVLDTIFSSTPLRSTFEKHSILSFRRVSAFFVSLESSLVPASLDKTAYRHVLDISPMFTFRNNLPFRITLKISMNIFSGRLKTAQRNESQIGSIDAIDDTVEDEFQILLDLINNRPVIFNVAPLESVGLPILPMTVDMELHIFGVPMEVMNTELTQQHLKRWLRKYNPKNQNMTSVYASEKFPFHLRKAASDSLQIKMKLESGHSILNELWNRHMKLVAKADGASLVSKDNLSEYHVQLQIENRHLKIFSPYIVENVSDATLIYNKCLLPPLWRLYTTFENAKNCTLRAFYFNSKSDGRYLSDDHVKLDLSKTQDIRPPIRFLLVSPTTMTNSTTLLPSKTAVFDTINIETPQIEEMSLPNQELLLEISPRAIPLNLTAHVRAGDTPFKDTKIISLGPRITVFSVIGFPFYLIEAPDEKKKVGNGALAVPRFIPPMKQTIYHSWQNKARLYIPHLFLVSSRITLNPQNTPVSQQMSFGSLKRSELSSEESKSNLIIQVNIISGKFQSTHTGVSTSTSVFNGLFAVFSVSKKPQFLLRNMTPFSLVCYLRSEEQKSRIQNAISKDRVAIDIYEKEPYKPAHDEFEEAAPRNDEPRTLDPFSWTPIVPEHIHENLQVHLKIEGTKGKWTPVSIVNVKKKFVPIKFKVQKKNPDSNNSYFHYNQLFAFLTVDASGSRMLTVTESKYYAERLQSGLWKSSLINESKLKKTFVKNQPIKQERKEVLQLPFNALSFRFVLYEMTFRWSHQGEVKMAAYLLKLALKGKIVQRGLLSSAILANLFNESKKRPGDFTNLSVSFPAIPSNMMQITQKSHNLKSSLLSKSSIRLTAVLHGAHFDHFFESDMPVILRGGLTGQAEDTENKLVPFIAARVNMRMAEPSLAPVISDVHISFAPLHLNIDLKVFKSIAEMLFKDLSAARYGEVSSGLRSSFVEELFDESLKSGNQFLVLLPDETKEDRSPNKTKFSPDGSSLLPTIQLVEQESDNTLSYISLYGVSHPLVLPSPRYHELSAEKPSYFKEIRVDPVVVVVAIRTSNIRSVDVPVLNILDSLPLDTPYTTVHLGAEKRRNLVVGWSELLQKERNAYLRQLILQSLPSAWLSNSFAIIVGIFSGSRNVVRSTVQGCSKPHQGITQGEGMFLGFSQGMSAFTVTVMGGLFQSLANLGNIAHKLMGGTRKKPKNVSHGIWLGVEGFFRDTFYTPFKDLVVKTPAAVFNSKSALKSTLLVTALILRCLLSPFFGFFHFFTSITEGFTGALKGGTQNYTTFRSEIEIGEQGSKEA
eukprot:GHVP01014977.1.p1 GENE.GHVP01014977.1~~GHVP01014977.1.p1  ORF type:complete len:3974 (-),score=704.26 GHVP01014977.1:297-12218(-)